LSYLGVLVSECLPEKSFVVSTLGGSGSARKKCERGRFAIHH